MCSHECFVASRFVESSSFTNNISWQIFFSKPMARLVEQMVLFDDDTITAVLLWLDSRRCLYIATNVVTLVQFKAYNLVQSIDEIKFEVASSLHSCFMTYI